MSQLKFTADITAAKFPLLYDWASRTVVQPQLDSGKPPEITPQILYCKDVLPTEQGYKSITYRDLIAAAPTPANISFANILTASDPAQNRALIGIASNSYIYIFTNGSPNWVDVTPVGWAGGDAVTMGNANGNYYIYLANKGCYRVNITGAALVPVVLIGITVANIVGMFSAVNYLCLWDATGSIYWSSTINPLDFVPSLITGAGTTIPYDLAGNIIAVISIGTGYVIYTTINIIITSFSNNTQFPWIFKQAVNGSGIANRYQVSRSNDAAFHVALTFSGMLQISPQGAEIIVPEVADFIAARIYESYNTGTGTLVAQELTSTVLTSVNIIGSRYIVLSYGISTFTDILVYDIALRRWGKLAVTHTRCFELEINNEGVIGPYNAASELLLSYANASGTTYNSTAVSINNPPLLSRNFGLLKADGTVSIALLDYASISGAAVLMLGKFQVVRNALLELQEVSIESIPTANTGFSLSVASSINGRDLSAPTNPTLVTSGSNVRVYKCRVIGKNHTLIFKGSFNLTAVEITALATGHR